MKNHFAGFYSPTNTDLDDAWKSENTLFVFDTNTFLNLYSYAEQTRKDFFSILDKIKDRIWIPYQVGLEYQRRRLSVVKDEKAVFASIEKHLDDVDAIFNKKFSELALNRRFPDLNKKTEKLHADIKRIVSRYKRSVKSWDDKQPCVRGHDSIRERLDKYFDGKVGAPPTDQDSLNNIYTEGKERYQNKVPPGYKDAAKEKDQESKFVYAGLEYERQYGDLILWLQTIEKAKEDHVENVIFITDDAKEDWWFIINSRGEKQIGPRAELREEIQRKSSINVFTIINTGDFLTNGKKLLEVDVKDESVSDASSVFDNKANLNVEAKRASALRKLQKQLENRYAKTLLSSEYLNSISSNTYPGNIDSSLYKKYKDLCGFSENTKHIDLYDDKFRDLFEKYRLQDRYYQDLIKNIDISSYNYLIDHGMDIDNGTSSTDEHNQDKDEFDDNPKNDDN